MFARNLRAAKFVFLIVLPFFGSAAPTNGAVVASNGFESPTFVPGALEGQDGWLKSGSGASSATVQNITFAPGGGTQAVQVNRAAHSDAFWGKPVSGQPGTLDAILAIDWDMLVQQTSSTSFGPFFGVQAYDYPGLLAGLGVDASTGEVLYQQAGTGFLLPGPVVSFNVWHHFRIELDYGAREFSVFVNGNLIANEIFVDGAGLDGFTDATISATAAAGDAIGLALTGTAYIDNFSITSSVPEPGSLALVGLGVALAVLKSRLS